MSLSFHAKSTVGVGQLFRYSITYHFDPKNEPDGPPEHLWLRIKNTSSHILRPAYLNGPFVLCASVRDASFSPYNDAPDDMLLEFEPNLKTSTSFWVKIPVRSSPCTWIAEITSQVIFSDTARVSFDITLARTKESARAIATADHSGGVFSNSLLVSEQDTEALWSIPLEATTPTEKNVHLVVLTHGLHSNATADMIYMKEQIEETFRACHDIGKDVIVVRAFTGNVCRTEKGVKYLGRNMAEWLLKELGFFEGSQSPREDTPKYTHLSVIGHSLGGLVQTFALGYIQAYHSYALQKLQLENFATLATPHLGISSENPQYVKFALDVGVIGKTGQDLGLAWKPNGQYRKADSVEKVKIRDSRPLLRLMALENSPSHEVVKRFKTHTLYANAFNDGIVPLRTAAMFFLDWSSLDFDSVTRPTQSDIKGPDVKEPVVNKTESSPEPLVTRPPAVARSLSRRYSASQSSESVAGQHSSDSRNPRPAFASTFAMSPTTTEEDKLPDELEQKQEAEDSGQAPDSNAPNLLSFLSLLKPQSGSTGKGRWSKVHERSQTLLSDEKKVREGSPPPKAGLLESASKLLNPPLPRREYLLKPESRSPAIVHDRIYQPHDIPPTRNKKLHSDPAQEGPEISGSDRKEQVKREKLKLEEKIARSWHADISWRKVLVHVEPEAHNNIIVRRMFPNAYGWPIVCHIASEFFGPVNTKEPDSKEHGAETGRARSDSVASSQISFKSGKDTLDTNLSDEELAQEMNEAFYDFDNSDPDLSGRAAATDQQIATGFA